MPKFQYINIKNLSLDLNNPRTVPQKGEIESIKLMISISRDRFFAVMDSILTEGYLPTENLLVVHDPENKNKYIVREGNRRAAILKIICGIYDVADFETPPNLVSKIKSLNKSWVKSNQDIQCAVYNDNESEMLNRTISLTHAKGEKAGRDSWNSVAKSRYNRDIKGAKENSLDLLEKYLLKGRNITSDQKERWSGDYPITVLDAAIPFFTIRIGYDKIEDLCVDYPKIKYHLQLDNLLRDIGLEIVGFNTIRDKTNDFLLKYNFPKPANEVQKHGGNNSSRDNTASDTENSGPRNADNASNAGAGSVSSGKGKKANGSAPSLGTAKQVKALLKGMMINGNQRSKVAALRDEILQLKIDKTPIAFCFILRSMFEISADIFCSENKIQTFKITKNGKKDFTLKEKLEEVKNFIIAGGVNSKAMHGAMTELAKRDGILSVMSLNQIVHNVNFSLAPADICRVFSNIYPLLEAMNR